MPVAGSVLVFVLGLLAVTGLELVKGSWLTSADQGTSVGSEATTPAVSMTANRHRQIPGPMAAAWPITTMTAAPPTEPTCNTLPPPPR